MSINKYKPHLFVLPEDDANHHIANGFSCNLNLNSRAIQVLPPAGGWHKVVDKFQEHDVPEMQKNLQRMIVLLIDFDGHEERLSYVESKIPEELRDRVFVLGVLSEPESLKRDIQRNWEEIGEALAKDCYENRNELWGHNLLKHNRTTLDRMISSVKPYLFN
ncbi:MAG: hypothetical protein GDA56_06255 [Hormoscilla sp. GM7CHS1pb]|nr:hypothetical protein [Hormoscilla sp. GM7CHS1pb]